MNKIFHKTIRIYDFKIIMFVFVMGALLFLYLFLDEKDPKSYSLYGGIAIGLIMAFIQLLLAWYEHKEVEEIKKLGIKKILPHRDDEKLYKGIIENANEEIIILGNTASRFFQDFADEKRSDKRALLDAFSRKVKFKLLLPDPKFLNEPDDISKAAISKRRIIELSKKYPDLFECRYYDHIPYHNLVLADNECLVGPIFPDISSRHSPAIYSDTTSVFVESYLKYFDYEWEHAKPCDA